MSWHPNDLVSDADLLAYESTILRQFGQVSWESKRVKVLEDWLWPALRGIGLDPDRLRTRAVPDAVLAFDGTSTYTDHTAAAASPAVDDLALGTILSSTTRALVVGSARPFRGLSVRMLGDVNAAPARATVQLWQDTWLGVAVTDGTAIVSGTTLSGGGALTWDVPPAWVTRLVDTDGPYYWARLSVNAALSAGTKGGQIGVVRRSVLCAPAAYKTLAWIFREAPASQDGPWNSKADYYETLADAALQRALGLAGPEFDTVTVDDVIDATEAAQTTASAATLGAGAWAMERG
jgi:hypothetical protein